MDARYAASAASVGLWQTSAAACQPSACCCCRSGWRCCYSCNVHQMALYISAAWFRTVALNCWCCARACLPLLLQVSEELSRPTDLQVRAPSSRAVTTNCITSTFAANARSTQLRTHACTSSSLCPQSFAHSMNVHKFDLETILNIPTCM